jgi:hypothetical protein
MVPFINHGTLIFWLYAAPGMRGAAFLLGSAELVIGTIMLLGLWPFSARWDRAPPTW